MIHRSINNLSSINTTKYKVIPSYLNKFINHLMVDGKKGIAVEMFADSLRLFSRKLQEGKGIPLLIKDQHQISTALHSSMDGQLTFRQPTGNDYQHCYCLTKRSTCSSKMSSSLGLHVLRSLLVLREAKQKDKYKQEEKQEAKHILITDEQFQDGHKNCSSVMSTGNDGLKQRVREKTILPSKQHHFIKSNTPSPSLISCLEQALINVEPSLEVRKKKIAGITRQIPSTLSKSRGQGLAIRWIVESARGRRRKEGKRFSECLAEELVSAYQKKGEPRQKRDALHKLAESNRSFLRYRWW